MLTRANAFLYVYIYITEIVSQIALRSPFWNFITFVLSSATRCREVSQICKLLYILCYCRVSLL